MSLYDKMATAALLHDNIQNPPTHIVTNVNHYNVPPGTAPSAITFSGTTSRLVVKYDTAGVGLGSSPIRITFNYRTIGRPSGKFSIGIRKVSGDTFTLLSEYPIDTPGYPTDGSGINLNTMLGPIKTAEIQVPNDYVMLANDKVSIEYPPTATAENTVQLLTSTTQSVPSGFTCQVFTGSYGAANVLALSIVDKVLVPI